MPRLHGVVDRCWWDEWSTPKHSDKNLPKYYFVHHKLARPGVWLNPHPGDWRPTTWHGSLSCIFLRILVPITLLVWEVVKPSLHYKQPRLSDGNAGALTYRGVSMRRTSPGKLQLLVHPSHLRACGRGWFKLPTSARVRPHTCWNNSSLWDINTKLSTRNNAQHWLWWAHVIRWYSHLLETIANT